MITVLSFHSHADVIFSNLRKFGKQNVDCEKKIKKTD